MEQTPKKKINYPKNRKPSSTPRPGRPKVAIPTIKVWTYIKADKVDRLKEFVKQLKAE